MSGTITRIGATSAGALLAIGLFATPPAGAGPSGRHGGGPHPQHAACFDETGATQGRSHSDPDGMHNGGFDKPGCTGGFDADRDGNNGCGNDADREDDNNGRCGPHRDRDHEDASGSSAAPSTPAGPVSADVEAAGTAADVDVTGAAVPGEAGPAATGPTTTVLGETLDRTGTLPRTGAGVAGLTLLGGLLCGGGRLAVLARRFLRIG